MSSFLRLTPNSIHPQVAGNNQQGSWRPPYVGILVLSNRVALLIPRPLCLAQEHQKKGRSPLALCNLLLLILVMTLGLDISLISLLMPSLFQTNRKYIIIPGLRKRTSSRGRAAGTGSGRNTTAPTMKPQSHQFKVLCPCPPPGPHTHTVGFFSHHLGVTFYRDTHKFLLSSGKMSCKYAEIYMWGSV